jgi:HD superfamily phosphodiesterase
MQGNLRIWIDEAEKKWLALLQEHALQIFSDTFLPSHDHTHHRRVWNIGKTLLLQIGTFNRHLDPDLVEGLLIAAMFHDLGMVATREKDHGRISREMCQDFFGRRKPKKPERYEEVLDAIERHDIKDERVYFGIGPEEAPDVLTLLSLADDLEALGTIGIYRYAEIYLIRGMKPGELGIHILGNASIRFNHISKSCGLCPEILRDYRPQYAGLVSFFDRYNQQLLVESDPAVVRSGYIGIVNAIHRLSVESRTRPEDFLAVVEQEDPPKLMVDFFKELKENLQHARSPEKHR